MKSLSATGMARHNRDLILNLLRREKILSRHEIRSRVGASPATVNRLTTQLIERGLLKEDGYAASTGGRPSTLLRFDADAGHVVAVDVGSSVIKGALVNLCGEVVLRSEEPVAAETARERLFEVQAAVQALVGQAKAGSKLLGAAVGVPGVVGESGKVTWAPALGWHDVPLGQALSEVTELPVHVENDANTLAIAEHRYGSKKGVASLVAINLGNGIGAGLIINGSLYRGEANAAGEIGYMLANPESLQSTYEGFGDLESKVGAEGIVARAHAAIPGLGTVSAHDIFSRARAGEAAFVNLLESVADELALAVANISVVLNPGTIILGGGVAGSADLLIPRLQARLAGRIPHVPQIVSTSLGTEGVIVGAAEMAIDAVGSLDEELG